MNDRWMVLFPFIAVVAILGVNALIWFPAIEDCNARGGELVTNAFNWPVCVPSAGGGH